MDTQISSNKNKIKTFPEINAKQKHLVKFAKGKKVKVGFLYSASYTR